MDISRENLRMIKKLSVAQLNEFLIRFYRDAFEEGLRVGESEFDDAIVLDEEDAIDRIGGAAFDKLIDGIKSR